MEEKIEPSYDQTGHQHFVPPGLLTEVTGIFIALSDQALGAHFGLTLPCKREGRNIRRTARKPLMT